MKTGNLPIFLKCPHCEKIQRRKLLTRASSYDQVCAYCPNTFYLFDERVEYFELERKGLKRYYKRVKLKKHPEYLDKLREMKKITIERLGGLVYE